MTICLWREGLAWRTLATSFTLPEAADIVVVGSGLSGLFAALELTRAGQRVVVLEAGEVASGASSRSGGMAGPSFFKLRLKGLAGRYGNETALRVMSESLDAFAWLKKFIETEEIDCDFRQNGRFRGARKPKAVAELHDHAESVNRHFDWPVEAISRRDLVDYIGSPVYEGAILYKKDATLHPGKLAIEVAKRLIAAGGGTVVRQKALKISQSYGGIELRTEQERIRAQSVVIATNGYSEELFPFFRRRVIPIRSAIVATEALSRELVAECLRIGRAYGEANRGVSYFRANPEGDRILFGGRALDWRKDNPSEYAKNLERRLKTIFPRISASAIEYSWSGRVAYTFDHIPHFGEHDGIYFVGGYCGHRLARRMLVGESETSVFAEMPFPSWRFYNGQPWFLGMILRWNEFLDSL